MSKKKLHDALASAHFTKEIQRVFALSALDRIYGMKQMSIVNMQNKMAELCHGCPDKNNVSLIDLCLSGRMQFAHLWNEEDITINSEKTIRTVRLQFLY
jgi:hypothetical protein